MLSLFSCCVLHFELEITLVACSKEEDAVWSIYLADKESTVRYYVFKSYEQVLHKSAISILKIKTMFQRHTVCLHGDISDRNYPFSPSLCKMAIRI